MAKTIARSENGLLPIWFHAQEVPWLVIGGGEAALESLRSLLRQAPALYVTIVAEAPVDGIQTLVKAHKGLRLLRKKYEAADFALASLLVIATGNGILDEKIQAEARQAGLLSFLPSSPRSSDFVLEGGASEAAVAT
jgi:siroheme synthase (precorrin-2 oxidase/ferrochelatase)